MNRSMKIAFLSLAFLLPVSALCADRDLLYAIVGGDKHKVEEILRADPRASINYDTPIKMAGSWEHSSRYTKHKWIIKFDADLLLVALLNNQQEIAKLLYNHGLRLKPVYSINETLLTDDSDDWGSSRSGASTATAERLLSLKKYSWNILPEKQLQGKRYMHLSAVEDRKIIKSFL